ncbi:hypothetical protein EBQ90_00215 [bacterium]|nr:hypothetical protein [bacterium]
MLLISDLDGTLLPKGGSVSVKDKDTLAQARLEGNLCVIATGRSLYGVETELEPDFPIDYLIFSSGAGIFDWKNKELIHHNSLSTEQVQTVFHQINEHEVDFTIQLSAPQSHRFYFHPETRQTLIFIIVLNFIRPMENLSIPSNFRNQPVSLLLSSHIPQRRNCLKRFGTHYHLNSTW